MNNIKKEEYLNKYSSLQELMDDYMHNKTNLNLVEYYELSSHFYIKEKTIIPNEIYQYLKQVFESDDCIVGVHRTGRMGEHANDILIDGLHITNHMDSGIANSDSIFDLKNNVTFHDNYDEFLKAISEGAIYKRDELGYGNAIIVKIPKLELKVPDALLKSNESIKILKPEYLCCYVKSYVNSDGKIVFDEIVTPKLAKYYKLEEIINSEAYKSYKENIEIGETVVYIPEYDNVENEYNALKEELGLEETAEKEKNGLKM